MPAEPLPFYPDRHPPWESHASAVTLSPGKTVKIRLWPILFLGFGTLVILVAFSGLSALRRARDSYAGISELYSSRQRTEQLLNKLRFDVQASAIAVRDFMLDPDASPTATRARFMTLQ